MGEQKLSGSESDHVIESEPSNGETPAENLLVRRKVPVSQVTRATFDADEPDLASTRALLIEERDQ